jgi:hypothetical protein
MKKILFFTTTITVLLITATTTFAQKKNQLEGVWKVAEVRISSKDSTTTVSTPQPGLIIFTKGYYSILTVRAAKPRTPLEPVKDPQNLTDAEKIALFDSWRPVVANSGTYEIKSSTISRHPIVAKSVDVMTRQTPVTDEFKLEGTNTLWLHPVDTSSAPQIRVKLMRVE